MLLRQLCIQLIQQHGRSQVAQLNIQPGKQLLIIIPAILPAAARQLLHRILLKQRQRGQRFTAAFVLIIIRRLLLFRPLIAVILRLFARFFLLLVYRLLLLRHGIAPSARCALTVAFCCFLVYHHLARIATLLDRGGFPLYNSHQCSIFYGEVISHAACFFRCACISRRIIGKNTQDAVRHGQARVSGGFSHTLPILAGFLFLGFAYGLLMRTKGFSFLYPMCMAMAIFGGSLEYITVSMLLIFGLCDETFSITCSADVPPEVDRGWFYLWVTVLDWCYWVAGAAVLLHI